MSWIGSLTLSIDIISLIVRVVQVTIKFCAKYWTKKNCSKNLVQSLKALHWKDRDGLTLSVCVHTRGTWIKELELAKQVLFSVLACEKRIVSNSFLLTTIFTRLACLEISNYCRASGVANNWLWQELEFATQVLSFENVSGLLRGSICLRGKLRQRWKLNISFWVILR